MLCSMILDNIMLHNKMLHKNIEQNNCILRMQLMLVLRVKPCSPSTYWFSSLPAHVTLFLLIAEKSLGSAGANDSSVAAVVIDSFVMAGVNESSVCDGVSDSLSGTEMTDVDTIKISVRWNSQFKFINLIKQPWSPTIPFLLTWHCCFKCKTFLGMGVEWVKLRKLS